MILHRAYSFDPHTFHRQLEARIVDQNVLNLDALLELAKETVDHASETTQKALEDLRFDPQVFDTSDEEVSWATYWYMIALSRDFKPVPSLSNHHPYNHVVLEQVLLWTGWSKTETQTLLRGHRLHTLVQSSNQPLFTARFSFTIDQYGGWLDVSSIEALWPRLLEVEPFFTRPPQNIVNVLTPFAQLWSKEPAEMLNNAYADAIEMLQTAIARKEALFLVLD